MNYDMLKLLAIIFDVLARVPKEVGKRFKCTPLPVGFKYCEELFAYFWVKRNPRRPETDDEEFSEEFKTRHEPLEQK